MIKKAAVLYMEPEYNVKEFTCAGCLLFLEDTKQCEILNPPEVRADQGCGLYTPGLPTNSNKVSVKRLIDAKVAGLGDGPFTCKRCEEFNWESLQDGRALCDKGVADFKGDTVHMNACCNAWKTEDDA